MPGPPTTPIAPDAWSEALAATDGLQLVVAGPGAGKTEFLARRAHHLVSDVGRPASSVLLLTFSRRAAADLRSRVIDLGGPAPPIASTFHSFAVRLLERHAPTVLGWQEMPALLTGPEQVGVVRRMLDEEDPADWPTGYREMLATRSFAEEVTDFMLRASERRLSPADVAGLATDRQDWRALPGFMERYRSRLGDRGRIDYAGILEAAIRVLADDGVRAEVGAEIGHVLVDEYQDTTTAQVELLRRLVAAHGNLTVTADVGQSIYSFRGADLGNVQRFDTDFADIGASSTILLDTSFRVPERILEAAARIGVPGLPGAPEVVHPTGPGGRVDVHVFDQRSHEAEWIASEIERLHRLDEVPLRRIAVLLRTKRRMLPELSRALDRRRIPHDRPDTRLIDHPAVRSVADLVLLATGTDGTAGLRQAARRLLLGPLLGRTLGEERAVTRARDRVGGTWAESFRAELDDGGALADLIDDATWATDRSAVDGFWHLWQALPQWQHLATDPNHAGSRAALASFAQVLGHLSDRDPDLPLATFLSLAAEDDFEASPLLGYAPDVDAVVLTTLHQAKGLEFDVAFIADAVDGALPDLRRSYSILGTNTLDPRQADARSAARFRIEEERRLVYTAMTRATRRVVWSATAAGIDEGDERPSRFLLELEPDPSPPSDHADLPVTPMEAEALLRRTAADPEAPAARRLGAVAVLASEPHPALRDPSSIVGVREPGPDRGVIPDAASFSPSQAMSYESCPRRYVLDRYLGAAAEGSVYMYAGSVVHEVAEALDRLRLADPEWEPEPGDVATALDAAFDPAWFGGGPWADAWRARIEGILETLLGNAPPGGPVEFVEHWLEVDIDGESWRGRADRIDRGTDGALRVVDYKTGSSPASVADAAESLQLGFYVLAASADPDVAARGTIGGAELWYPAKDQKAHFATRSFDMGKLDEVRDRLASIAAAIRLEEFPPVLNPGCDGCAVRTMCPEWPEGQDAFLP
jgi:superfamily I DNA/RNA helicase/RecB family exonuclease